jgi:hypothetical protein
MKGINHLVLTSRDLEAQRLRYEGLGFTLAFRAQHSFGTGNSVVMMHGTYLELISITRPQDVPEDRPGHFSFPGFNRDYLARHEGFSMMVLDTPDAHRDIQAWHAAGVQTYEPFDWSRMAKMPDGTDGMLSFSLAFVSHPAAPWFGFFACQTNKPEFYEQPRYLDHPNGALSVQDVWVAGDAVRELSNYVATVTGVPGVAEDPDRTTFQTRTGKIVLAHPRAFESAFGVSAPHPGDGPHLAGFTIACRNPDKLKDFGVKESGGRYVVPPEANFDTAIAFVKATR